MWLFSFGVKLDKKVGIAYFSFALKFDAMGSNRNTSQVT